MYSNVCFFLLPSQGYSTCRGFRCHVSQGLQWLIWISLPCFTPLGADYILSSPVLAGSARGMIWANETCCLLHVHLIMIAVRLHNIFFHRQPKDTPCAPHNTELPVGFILSRNMLDRDKLLDKKHCLTSIAASTVSPFVKTNFPSERSPLPFHMLIIGKGNG
jgi:hypothetical protein